MKILITGVSGFVGSHLAEYLLKKEPNVTIFGSFRHRSNLENIAHIKEAIGLIDCNVIDAAAVSRAIKQIRPDVISHLAAQSFVPTSWIAPHDTFTTNVVSTINILEAVKEYCPNCIVHIPGSSEEYGLVKPSEVPITESNPLRPLSPYGVSKVAQDLIAQQYFRSYGLNIKISRAFNHEGPRRGEFFVTSSFALSIISAMKNGSKIKVGNLDAIRDFTDVRDMVEAYWLLITKGKSGEPYNICSGEGIKISKLLDLFLEVSKIKDYVVETDDKLLRPSDVPILVGDCSKFVEDTGWERSFSLEETIMDILDYWLDEEESKGGRIMA